jgi:hypothetical protein
MIELISGRQAAIILLRLLQLRAEETGPASRAQISEATLKKIWARFALSKEFVAEVQEWLARAGWTFFYAGRSYALVRTETVAKWARVTSKRLGPDTLRAIEWGEFEYKRHEKLLFSRIEDFSVEDDGG